MHRVPAVFNWWFAGLQFWLYLGLCTPTRGFLIGDSHRHRYSAYYAMATQTWLGLAFLMLWVGLWRRILLQSPYT